MPLRLGVVSSSDVSPSATWYTVGWRCGVGVFGISSGLLFFMRWLGKVAVVLRFVATEGSVDLTSVFIVVPAKAGASAFATLGREALVPAFAGMTDEGKRNRTSIISINYITIATHPNVASYRWARSLEHAYSSLALPQIKAHRSR